MMTKDEIMQAVYAIDKNVDVAFFDGSVQLSISYGNTIDLIKIKYANDDAIDDFKDNYLYPALTVLIENTKH